MIFVLEEWEIASFFFLACKENLLLLDLLNKASSPAEIGEVTCTTHVGAEFMQKFFYLLLLLLKILSRVPLHCLDAVPLLKQYLVDFSTIVLRYIKSTDPRHFQMDPIVNHVILMRVMWLLSYQTNSFSRRRNNEGNVPWDIKEAKWPPSAVSVVQNRSCSVKPEA